MVPATLSTPPLAQRSMSSVTERLEHLRRTQARRATDEDFEPAHLRAATRSQRTPGPPAPRSWLKIGESRHGGIIIDGEFADEINVTRRPALSAVGGTQLPPQRSLLHQTLKGLAADIEWHAEYDHEYLSAIPTRLKPVLLSYIATYSPNGASLQVLRFLFDVQDTTDCETVECINLGGALGRALTLKQLNQYWVGRQQLGASKTSAAVNSIPDSWDEESISTSLRNSTLRSGPTVGLHFPSLVHLCLSHPSASISWTEFLHFARHLGSLSSLSLAFWPFPSIPGSSNTSRASASNLTMDHDSEDATADAAHLLSHLARCTPNLRSLDLTGCSTWWYVLRTTTPLRTSSYSRSHDSPRLHNPAFSVSFDSVNTTLLPRSAASTTLSSLDRVMNGIDWASAWPRLARLHLVQPHLPTNINAAFFARAIAVRGRAPTIFAPGELDAPHRDRPHAAAGLRDSVHAPPVWRAPTPPLPSYSVTSSSPAVLSSVAAVQRRRAWCAAESDALLVEGWIRGRRKEGSSTLSHFTVEHGWGVNELLAAGYEPWELEDAGLHVPVQLDVEGVVG